MIRPPAMALQYLSLPKCRVAGAGQAGVASMLLCNTTYYTVAFLALWLGLGTPRGLGLVGSTCRFAEVGPTINFIYLFS